MKNRITWPISTSAAIRPARSERSDFAIMYAKIARIANAAVHTLATASCLCCSTYSVISASATPPAATPPRRFQRIGSSSGCEPMCASVRCISMKFRIASSMPPQQTANAVCQPQ